MIKDPWPFNFEPYNSMNDMTKRERVYCPYSKRFIMLCGAPREKCRNCYMKQQDLTDAQMLKEYNPVVEHYCDRCGRKIDLVDKIVYMHLQDREAKNLINLELCSPCVVELAHWIDRDEEESEGG